MNTNEIPSWAQNSITSFEHAGSQLKKYAKANNFSPTHFASQFNPQTGEKTYCLWNSRRAEITTDAELDYVQTYL
jgi:hypothetical protein